ncbi:zinc finger MYM-type protein 1-like [Bacillus rossius redtenbacheri]|uniref:zinc finger MYM-type protein 1-like n=1 Tax=Bacillus rossius redtenbacheri TaxID=93214 RepID=UPI002FDEF37A
MLVMALTRSLVSKPFNKWKDALETFEKHARTKYHLNSEIAAKMFLDIYDCKQADVSELLSQKVKTDAERNRKIISTIVETLIFNGRQEIPLRGHRDSGRITVEEPTNNDGNFRALLRLQARAGDSLLNEHINSGRGNAMYISPTVQNELLSLIGKQIQENVLERIKKAKFFTVLGDKTTDISYVEQFSLCVRYVDIDLIDIREDFLTFVPVYDVTGAGIASTIKTELLKLGLEMTNLRGQGYDGAGAMSGHLNGVQAIIRKDCPKALYTHCSSHVLNLCLNYAAKTDVIRNCFFTISEVASFFRGSAQRTKILKEGLEVAGILNSVVHNYNDTRWVERHDCVAVFSESFLSIVQALELLIERRQGDLTAKIKAIGLHSNLCSFEFIVTLLVMSKML